MRRCSWSSVALAALVIAGCQEDPFDFGQPRDCTIASQNEWVYDLMLNVYLWADELPEVDPRAFEDPAQMVSEIRYDEVDRWSRVSDLATTEALFEEGKVIGLGALTGRDADGTVLWSFVDPMSPAGQAGLQRGDVLLGVAGYTTEELDDGDLWEEAFGPNEPGVVVEMTVQTGGETLELSVTKDWYPLVTVPFVEVFEHAGKNVGYLMFTTFVEPSVDELDLAFDTFREAGVRDVIIDLRYNGGGRISTARHLMNLLVGDAADGGVAYKVDYAGVLSDEDSTRHLTKASASLPSPGQVVFITTGRTLSASELVINSVRPYVDVKLVGARTGGKPVGSRQWEFCDKVAHPITFRLLNADDTSDYFDGFATDCDARDDISTPVPSAEEASTAAALALIAGDGCPAPEPDGGEADAPTGPRLHTPRPDPAGAYPGLPELRSRY